jgi:hypothetical protein
VLDPLDWLDLAAFSLTRVGASAPIDAATEDFERWLASNHPRWRIPMRPGGEIVDAAARVVGSKRWTLISLEYASAGLLAPTDVGWNISEDWTAATMMRWRLPLGTIQAAALAQRPISESLPRMPHVDAGERLARLLRDHGVTDLHVHVGATVPFDLLFALVTERSLQADIDDIDAQQFLDSAETPYSAALTIVLALLLRIALDAYADIGATDFASAISAVLVPDLVDAIVAGRAWQFLQEPDPSTVGEVPRYRVASRMLVGDPSRHRRLDESVADLFERVVHRKAKWLASARADPICAGTVE